MNIKYKTFSSQNIV